MQKTHILAIMTTSSGHSPLLNFLLFVIIFLSIHYTLPEPHHDVANENTKSHMKMIAFCTEMMGPTIPRHARKSGLPSPLFLPLVSRPNLQLHYSNTSRHRQGKHTNTREVKTNFFVFKVATFCLPLQVTILQRSY